MDLRVFGLMRMIFLLLGVSTMNAYSQNSGHGSSSPVANASVANTRQAKLPRVIVDRNKVMADASENEVLAQARSTCDSMLNDQAWVFYGFWASERNASDLQSQFPNELEKYSARHLEHTIACKRVETRAYYGVRNYDEKLAKNEEKGMKALLMIAPIVGLMSALSHVTLAPNEREALSLMEAVCEARPEDERQILQRVSDCANTDKKIEQAERFAKNAARRGDQEQINSYREEIAELEASRPEGCANALELARNIKATEFVKAPLDACQEIKSQK